NRSEMLVALGTLVAFAAVIRWEPTRPARAWTAVGVAFLAALLCRENAAVLPVLVAALVWLLHPEEDARTRARRLVSVVTLALLPSTRLLTAASHASGFLAQPASGLILVAERTLYMPSAGLMIPLAFALAALGRRYGPAAIVAAGVGLVAALAPITYARNVDW